MLEASGGAELFVSLATFLDPDDRKTVESGEAWFEAIETQLSPELRQRLRDLGSGCSKVWLSLTGLLLKGGRVTASDVLERLAAMPAEEVRLHLLGYHLPAHHLAASSVSAEQIKLAAEGDRKAQAVLLDDPLYRSHNGGEGLGRLLALDAAGTKQLAQDILGGWYREVFVEMEADAVAALERDVELKRRQLAGLRPLEWVVKASGIDFVPEPGIERVVLLPQIAMRPWAMIIESDDTRFIFYPLSDEALQGESSAPPAQLVRMHRALGDEKRLRILRMLADRGSATLQEVADELGIAKSTAHHHLVQLRSARLAQVTTGEEWRWQLQRDTIPEASGMLDVYLKGRVPRREP